VSGLVCGLLSKRGRGPPSGRGLLSDGGGMWRYGPLCGDAW
jgi:hypothetical protein